MQERAEQKSCKHRQKGENNRQTHKKETALTLAWKGSYEWPEKASLSRVEGSESRVDGPHELVRGKES